MKKTPALKGRFTSDACSQSAMYRSLDQRAIRHGANDHRTVIKTNPRALPQARGESRLWRSKTLLKTTRCTCSAGFLRHSGAANQQAHKKINKYRRRNREEERTYEGGPERRPNDA